MKRMVSLFLLISLLAVSFAACGSEGGPASVTTAADAGTAETTEAVTEEPRIDPGLPERDFGGYEFRVLTKGTTNVHWKSFDISTPEQNGEPINDAVYARNLKVGEQYNFTFLDVPCQDYSNIPGEASKLVLAGDTSIDMFCFNVASLITDHYIYNLRDVPYMDLSQPYYDQNIQKDLELFGALYAVTGDLTIMDNNATICVQFNKQLAEDYGLADTWGGDMYTLVNESRWTFDTLYEIAKAVAKDVDGDGKMANVGDIWGFGTETGNYALLYMGAGERLCSKDSEGYPVITMTSDRITSVVEKITQIQTDKKVSINASEISSSFSDVWSECMDKNFAENRVMFNMAGLNRATLFRTMETDFGIIPVPKFNEEQDRYYSPVSLGCANYIALPANLPDPERTGIILEALSCESYYTLTPAYYETTLMGKAIRDEESRSMLELIFDTTLYDLGSYFGWGSLANVLQKGDSYASAYASAETAALAAIEKTVTAIRGE